MRRLVIILAACSLAAAGWAWWHTAQGPATTESDSDRVRIHTVGRQKLIVGLIENGMLRAIRHQNIRSSQRNQMTISWVIEENKEVKKGDRVIEFDRKDLEKSIIDLDKEYQKNREDLERLKDNQIVRKAEGEAWIRDAENAIAKAGKALRDYQFIDAPKKQREMDDAVTKAEEEKTKAEVSANEAQDKADASAFESAQKRSELEKQSQSTDAQLTAIEKRISDARSQRIQFRSRTYPEDLTRLRREVESAQLTLGKEKMRANDHVSQGEQGIRNLDKAIQRNRKQFEDNTKSLTECVVTAPIDGVVLYGDPEGDRYNMAQYMKVGQQMWGGGNVMMSIPDMSSFVISVPIPEHYRGRVQPGSEAQITVPAIPGLMIKGKLASISTMAKPREEGNPSSPKVFTGKVEMEASDKRMVSGMSAKVTLVAKVIEDCLCVPIEAVWTEGDVSYVFVDMPTGIERHQVETGQLDDHFVEIRRGLTIGERVWLYDPTQDARTVRADLVKLPPAVPTVNATPPAPATASATAAASTASATTASTNTELSKPPITPVSEAQPKTNTPTESAAKPQPVGDKAK